MDSIKRDARLAGAVYVPFTLVGFFALEYVPSKLLCDRRCDGYGP